MAEKSIQAGDLDRILMVLVKDSIKNGKGETVALSPSPFAQNVHCRHQNVSGSEKPTEGRETAFSTDQFIIRYRGDLDAAMTIVFEGQNYDILNVSELNGSRKQWTEITARKHD